MDVDIVKEVLKALQNLDFSKCDADDVRALLAFLPIHYLPFCIEKGASIQRARKGEGFKTKPELTYCPREYCTKTQRATLKGDTMFYGVLSDDQSHLENSRAIAAVECSNLCRQGIGSIGKETFSIGHWEAIKPLSVISLINDSTFPEIKDNKLLNIFRNSFMNYSVRQKLSNDELAVLHFLSNEFSKVVSCSDEYLISATLTTDMLSDLSCDGIVYPSVQLGGQAGLNVVLTTSAADDKLKFVRALEQTLYKNGKHSFIRLEKAYQEGIELPVPEQPSNEDLAKILKINNLDELPLV